MEKKKCTFDGRIKPNFCYANFCNNKNKQKKCNCTYDNGSIRYAKSFETRTNQIKK